MQKLLNSFSINRGAGGSIPMIDSLDDKITSIRQRIEQFKRDHPELYESEKNEQRESQQHASRKDISKSEELRRALHAQKKNSSL
tara:strand:- start:4430 stop:4684 length:255 start_codon:yes stop_codon:yes gene_type:complete